MDTKNTIPGFTAEDAIFEVQAHYRTAGVFGTQTNPGSVKPAMMRMACANLAFAIAAAAPGSFTRAVFQQAYDIACPNDTLF
jgi:hypothetical protein